MLGENVSFPSDIFQDTGNLCRFRPDTTFFRQVARYLDFWLYALLIIILKCSKRDASNEEAASNLNASTTRCSKGETLE